MTPDRDIHHYTQVLVKHHGKGASARAATRANTMLKAGDLDSYDTPVTLFDRDRDNWLEPCGACQSGTLPTLSSTFRQPFSVSD